MSNKVDRRRFLKFSFLTGLFFVGSSNFLLRRKALAADLKLGDSGAAAANSLAKNLKYCPDASSPNADKTYKCDASTAKKGSCVKCQYHTKVDDKYGKCQVMQGVLVKNTGICNSFTPKG